ncbi:MAG: hypothetical protein KDC54_00765, partial [Lewinella sp.]|nr:hypothetical protein [Lewinella sp.]
VLFVFNSLSAQTTLTIENNSMWDIYYIYIHDESECVGFYDGDMLGPNDILESGESIQIDLRRSGSYDIKIVDEDGDECLLRNVLLERDITWTITDESHLDCIN